VQLDPAAFNGFLNAIGQSILWRRASLCPCVDLNDGAARPGCPLCHALGVTWEAPVAATTGVTSMRVKREWAAFGLWESGDEVLTIPSDSPFYACGEKDRVVMTNSSEPFQSILVRGGGETVRFPIISIDKAYWLAPDGVTICTAGVPVVDGYQVSWPDDVGPPVGVQYSLRGRKRQEYYLLNELPQDRAHFHGLALPRLVHLRRFDLFGRVASNNGS
jgi:hypothetical protein